MPTVHLVVKGKVQGVFYRANAKKKADETGIKGWVQNTPDGNVEIKATASNDTLKAFTAWCKQGPKKAEVEHVEVTEIADEVFENFVIRK